jgi:hypothetical protein
MMVQRQTICIFQRYIFPCREAVGRLIQLGNFFFR